MMAAVVAKRYDIVEYQPINFNLSTENGRWEHANPSKQVRNPSQKYCRNSNSIACCPSRKLLKHSYKAEVNRTKFLKNASTCAHYLCQWFTSFFTRCCIQFCAFKLQKRNSVTEEPAHERRISATDSEFYFVPQLRNVHLRQRSFNTGVGNLFG